MATKAGMKYVNLEIPEELHYQIKLQAVKEKKHLKDFMLEIINTFFKKNDYLIAEPLDEDDLKDMEPGKDDIVNGDFETLEKVYKELENEDRNN